MKKWLLMIINAPKRLRKKRLETGGMEAKIVSMEDGPPMEDYKIATAVVPDYEHLEVQVSADR